MGLEQMQQLERVQKRSQQSLHLVQQAIRSALDTHRKTLAEVDLDDMVDDLLSEDSDDFLTKFAQTSGQ